MTREEFEASVRGFIAIGAGLPGNYVIPGNDNAPAPQSVFASLLLLTDDVVGFPVIQIIDRGEEEGLQYRQRLDRRALYSLQFFRDGASAAAYKFIAWAASDLGVQEAAARGFRGQRFGGVRQIDAAVGDIWEKRIGLDLMVDYWQYDDFDIHALESAPIEVAGFIAEGTSSTGG